MLSMQFLVQLSLPTKTNGYRPQGVIFVSLVQGVAA